MDILSNDFSMLLSNKVIATQENLLKLHEKIKQHLQGEILLTKMEILNHLTILNKMEFPNLEFKGVAKYAEDILVNILRKLSKSDESFSQSFNLSLESFKIETKLSNSNNTNDQLCINNMNTYITQDFKTASELFPVGSSSPHLISEITLSKKRKSDTLDMPFTGLTTQINNPVDLLLNIDGVSQFNDETLQLPSEMLTNNNFVEECSQGNLANNFENIKYENYEIRDMEVEDGIPCAPDIINHEALLTEDQNDILNETLTEKNYLEWVENGSNQDIFTIEAKDTNKPDGDSSREQSEHGSIIFDLENAPYIISKSSKEQECNDIDQISERMKEHVILNDADDTNVIIMETPSKSISAQSFSQHKSQSKSFLNFYKSNYKKRLIGSRKKVCVLRNNSKILNRENTVQSQSVSDLKSDGTSEISNGNEVLRNITQQFSFPNNNHCTNMPMKTNINISQNKAIIDGSEIANDQETSSEESYAKNAENQAKQIAQQRSKYKSKWKTMSVKEKISLKFIKKFGLNIFEDPVESLLNIDYKTTSKKFNFPRITKEEMNEKLKSSNAELLIDTLIQSLREASNQQANDEINKENISSTESTDEEDDDVWLKQFVEQSKLSYIKKKNTIQREFQSVLYKNPSERETKLEEDAALKNVDENYIDSVLWKMEDFSWLN